jgi:hypothetical protein
MKEMNPLFSQSIDECEELQKEKEFPSAKDELSLIGFFADDVEE